MDIPSFVGWNFLQLNPGCHELHIRARSNCYHRHEDYDFRVGYCCICHHHCRKEISMLLITSDANVRVELHDIPMREIILYLFQYSELLKETAVKLKAIGEKTLCANLFNADEPVYIRMGRKIDLIRDMAVRFEQFLTDVENGNVLRQTRLTSYGNVWILEEFSQSSMANYLFQYSAILKEIKKQLSLNPNISNDHNTNFFDARIARIVAVANSIFMFHPVLNFPNFQVKNHG
jgi:hypothetical protein